MNSNFKVRAINHPYGSAKAACDAWMNNKRIWGQPLDTQTGGVHVYGLWKTDWHRVWLHFKKNRIVVMHPPESLF